MLITCLMTTIIVAALVGIGLGYNYCFVETRNAAQPYNVTEVTHYTTFPYQTSFIPTYNPSENYPPNYFPSNPTQPQFPYPVKHMNPPNKSLKRRQRLVSSKRQNHTYEPLLNIILNKPVIKTDKFDKILNRLSTEETETEFKIFNLNLTTLLNIVKENILNNNLTVDII